MVFEGVGSLITIVTTVYKGRALFNDSNGSSSSIHTGVYCVCVYRSLRNDKKKIKKKFRVIKNDPSAFGGEGEVEKEAADDNREIKEMTDSYQCLK